LRYSSIFWEYDRYIQQASEEWGNVPELEYGSSPISDDTRVELCIIPDRRYLFEECTARQLVIARQIKQVLERYHHDTAKTKDYAMRTLGKIKIYTAEDMPACPCCGLRETFEVDVVRGEQ
jgi:hypothetical protein